MNVKKPGTQSFTDFKTNSFFSGSTRGNNTYIDMHVPMHMHVPPTAIKHVPKSTKI